MRTVGVTGGIGSGKSTVCAVFGVLGIPVFDSDAVGRQLLDRDKTVRSQVAHAFGEELFKFERADRKALAALVFNDAAALAKLNAIIHPAVRRAFQEWIGKQHAPYAIQEAAILVETGAYTALDHLVVVTAPERDRVARVMQRDGRTEEEVRARLRNQATDAERAAVADTIIVNDGTRPVIPQVLELHERLKAEAEP